MQSLKIEMIHDIVCSWCPIGYRNLETALRNLAGEIEAEIYFLPFELNPDMPAEGVEIVAQLKQRMGWTGQQVMDYRKNLLPTAEKAGVTIDFSRRTHYYNTFKAHCLMHFAEGHGRQVEMNEVFIDAYHAAGVDVSSEEQLLKLAELAGLDYSLAAQALVSDEVTRQVIAKQRRAKRWPVKSVPAFIFDGEFFVSGSNSVGFFEDYLRTRDDDIPQLPGYPREHDTDHQMLQRSRLQCRGAGLHPGPDRRQPHLHPCPPLPADL